MHDLYSIYLAARLAAAGLASCSLLDEPNPATHIPGELYARYIVPTQPHRGWYTNDEDGRAEIGELIHILNDVESELHGLGGPCNDSIEMQFSTDDDALSFWGCDAAEALAPDLKEDDEDDALLYARTNPDWFYYRTAAGDKSAAKSFEFSQLLATFALGGTNEKQGSTALLIRRGPLENAINNEDLKNAKAILADLNYGEFTEPLAIPMEDCLVVSSGLHTFALRTRTGKDAYNQEIDRTLRQQDSFLSWARPISEFRWTPPVDPARFEKLTYDLLSAEPNVRRVRFVGSTNDSDAGRDLIVDMVTPLTKQEIEAGEAQGDKILTPRRILVQCKTKRDPDKSVSKSDVRDIRDTIERHEADGYWLFASSHITAQLVEHLEILGRKTYVDWWTRHEIEAALRRNPRLIDAHRDILRPSQEESTTT
ncbi:restriction endonuclease [Amycolatopsis nivea]